MQQGFGERGRQGTFEVCKKVCVKVWCAGGGKGVVVCVCVWKCVCGWRVCGGGGGIQRQPSMRYVRYLFINAERRREARRALSIAGRRRAARRFRRVLLTPYAPARARRAAAAREPARECRTHAPRAVCPAKRGERGEKAPWHNEPAGDYARRAAPEVGRGARALRRHACAQKPKNPPRARARAQQPSTP